MGHPKGSKKMPAVLFTVLFIARLSSATPVSTSDLSTANIPEEDGAVGPLREPSSITPPDGMSEIEQRMRTAILVYQESASPTAMQYINWVLYSQNRRDAVPKHLIKLAQNYAPLTDFWPTVERYVTYEYKRLKTHTIPIKSFFRRLFPSRPAPPELSKQDVRKFEQIQTLIDTVMIKRRATLTATLLNLRGPDYLEWEERKAFERTIITALKRDMKIGVDGTGMREISHALVLNSLNTKDEHVFAEDLFRNPVVKNILKHARFNYMKDEYRTDFFTALKHPNAPRRFDFLKPKPNLQKVGSVDVGLNAYGRTPEPKAFFFSCQNVRAPRRSRRSFSECLLSEKEYREVVKKVEKEGSVKEVLNTEKFMELLDRVTAEDSAAKRQQLLELGAVLSEDPEVTLEGDYVSLFTEVVKPAAQKFAEPVTSREKIFPSPVLGADLVDNGKPRYMGQIGGHRIAAVPLDILEKQFKMGNTAYQELIANIRQSDRIMEIHKQFERPILPLEINRPLEITPIRVLPVTEFKLPTPKIRLPRIRFG